jgi:hypothetical protein
LLLARQIDEGAFKQHDGLKLGGHRVLGLRSASQTCTRRLASSRPVPVHAALRSRAGPAGWRPSRADRHKGDLGGGLAPLFMGGAAMRLLVANSFLLAVGLVAACDRHDERAIAGAAASSGSPRLDRPTSGDRGVDETRTRVGMRPLLFRGLRNG